MKTPDNERRPNSKAQFMGMNLTPKGEHVKANVKKKAPAIAVGAAVLAGSSAYLYVLNDQAHESMEKQRKSSVAAICVGAHVEKVGEYGTDVTTILANSPKVQLEDGLGSSEGLTLIGHAVAEHQRDYKANSPKLHDGLLVPYYFDNDGQGNHLQPGTEFIAPDKCERP